MPGVHGLQHIEGLGSPHFTDNDSVRAHPKGISDQLPNVDLPFSFHVGGAGFHPSHMAVGNAELSHIFNGDDPLIFRNEVGQGIEQGRLSAPGSAGDNNVQFRFDHTGQEG
ncbi:Uncharacterised protein [Mycobacterium tuberculosis]|nr:Uncharacterised protein [Mycobacterium tuberculosis]